MQRIIPTIARTVVSAMLLAGAAGGTARPGHASDGGPVDFPTGRPVELAVVIDPTTDWGQGVLNAVHMAVQGKSLNGAAFQVDIYDAPCNTGPTDVAANVAAAQNVLADSAILAVIGHGCSYAFAGMPAAYGGNGPCPTPVSPNGLAVYEAAGMPTINGSTTNRCLPGVGPTMFNSTAVADPRFNAWYAAVQRTPGDQLWRARYAAEFGASPTDYADLYYDATSVLVAAIRSSARPIVGGISIDRAAIASALRHTSGFPGATCAVDIDPATGYRVFQMPPRACTV